MSWTSIFGAFEQAFKYLSKDAKRARRKDKRVALVRQREKILVLLSETKDKKKRTAYLNRLNRIILELDNIDKLLRAH